MGKLIKFLVLTTICAVLLAYVLYDDTQPVGFSQQMTVTAWFAAFKLMGKVYNVLVFAGISEHESSRMTVSWFPYLHPAYYGHDPDIVVREDTIENVFVYIFQPSTRKSNRRGIVYFHGGGWVVGSIVNYHRQMQRLSKQLDVVLIFPEYRRAPENPFPAAFDDCLDVTKYVLNNGAKLGIDPNRVAVMGDSCGGNLAAAVSYDLKIQQFKPMPALQVMLYPVLQGENLDTPSYRYNKDGPFLTVEMMAFYFAAYLNSDNYQQYIPGIAVNNHTTAEVKKSNAKSYLNQDSLPKDKLLDGYEQIVTEGQNELWEKFRNRLRDPRFTPLYVDDLSGLPKAYISTCDYDVLRDDGFFYAKRLREAKVKVHHANLQLCFHCWAQLTGTVDNLNEYFADMVKYIDSNL